MTELRLGGFTDQSVRPAETDRRRVVLALTAMGLSAGSAQQRAIASPASTTSPPPSEGMAVNSAGRFGAFASVPPRFGPAVPGGSADFFFTDAPRGRRIGVRIRWPAIQQANPLIVYSPGLGSGLSNGQAWCETWQRAGFVVVTLSHPHTNESLWDTRVTSFSQNMTKALDAAQYPARVADCRYVLDLCLRDKELSKWIDPDRIGAAGHSYGALTVQALAGQAGPSQRDDRIRAFVSLSPGAGSKASAARMKLVKLPFLSLTGKQDGKVSFIHASEHIRLGVPLAQRLWVHEALPAGNRFLVVLDQADHMSFAGETVNRPTVRFSRDVPQSDEADRQIWHRVSALSTQFFQASLGLAAPPGSAQRKSGPFDVLALRDALQAQLGPEDRLECDALATPPASTSQQVV
jgi:predicted dienelactone hydrolase